MNNTTTPGKIDADISQEISRAMSAGYILVTLRMGQWQATISDKTIAHEAAIAHGASPEAINATRTLMAGADEELRAVKSAQAAIRTQLYAMSSPYSTAGDGQAKKGPRLVESTRGMEVIQRLSELESEYKRAMDSFLAVYDQRVQAAMRAQGDRANATEYPSHDAVSEMFTVSIDIQPFPSIADFSRVSIPAPVAQALGNRMAKRQLAAVETAFRDVQQRTLEKVANMAEVLAKKVSGERTSLKATLVSNVKDMTQLLRESNYVNDPELDAIADTLDRITTVPIETLRVSEQSAQEVSEAAKQAAERIAGYTMPGITTPTTQAAVSPQEATNTPTRYPSTTPGEKSPETGGKSAREAPQRTTPAQATGSPGADDPDAPPATPLNTLERQPISGDAVDAALDELFM